MPDLIGVHTNGRYIAEFARRDCTQFSYVMPCWRLSPNFKLHMGTRYIVAILQLVAMHRSVNVGFIS